MAFAAAFFGVDGAFAGSADRAAMICSTAEQYEKDYVNGKFIDSADWGAA
jgi:hypothetical protein